MRAAEADGAAVSGMVDRGGVMSAFGSTEEAGGGGGEGKAEMGVGIFFCLL